MSLRRTLHQPPACRCKVSSLGDLPKELVLHITSYLGTSSRVIVKENLVITLDRVQIQDEDSSELNIVENYFFKDPEKPTDPAVLDGITDLKNLTVSCKSLYSLLLPVLYRKSGLEDDWYALRWACFHGSLPALKEALHSGADVDYKFATQADHTDWLGYKRVNGDALGHPKALRQRTFNAGTPLLAALHGEVFNHKNHDVVKYLLSHGADVNLEDYNWTAPLHVVSRYGVRCRSMVELLLQHGADVTSPGPQGWTPLHLTCWRLRWTSADTDTWLFGRRALQSDNDKAMRPVARMLIEAGADLKAQTNSSGSCGSPEPTRSGLTPLELALHCQNDTMVKFLREQECRSLNL
ncbi:serine/threonine-protein phosphatase 6 regulatory ankyrin repeat subunit B [Colletotrichum liriopes]|uniref:Serine/threonine-protein phosphatase 6 regulatory ankyrin repeat subunit B n=1 Tax=Colletotrichum liriopes TaxID=708192 RepID=A0AA37LTI9_9PEZI|nr:serine/threonine-protein phosphatase 6 regulatory ankyrin repeat subunit B [Colletotrichum liriopes]